MRSLVDGGITALGPALCFSVGMCSRWKSGRILLMTDGCSNLGVGAIEDPLAASNPQSRELYRHIATSALRNNVVIDILGVDSKV